MKVSRIGILVAGALALFCAGAGGFLYYQQYEEEKEIAARNAIQQAYIQAEKARFEAQRLRENTRPLADKFMNEGLPKTYPRPTSDWKTTEKAIYQKLLSNGQFDVLVVPFQVQEYALDRPTRSFMTAELALLVSTAQKIHVPDPYIVARALGDGERRLDPNDVYDLADKIGVKKIIWGYVGHSRNLQMALTIQYQDRDSNGILNARTAIVSKNFEHIAFTDTHPPIDAYQTILPDILSAIGVTPSLLPTTKSDNRGNDAKFPPRPLDMLAALPEPTHDAQYFQLLAYLTPDSAERTQERFAEKSLLALLSISPDSPDYPLLKARALMLLGYRPAALQLLGEPKTLEEKELVAMLNGNQPEIESYSSQIKSGIGRFMGKLDANNIASIYSGANKNKSIASAKDLQLPGNIWPFLAARAFLDLDTWSQFENIYLKQLLDLEFPIKDFTAEVLIRGSMATGDAGKLQTAADLSVINHVRKLLELNASKWCCEQVLAHPTSRDYLDLIEAIGEDDLMRRARFLTFTQGAPERSLEFLNKIESAYKGHTRFTMARAAAQLERAKAVDGAEKDGLLKSSYDNMYNVLYWEQGQTQYSDVAFSNLTSTGHNDYGYPNNIYASDYPFRSYYDNWEQGQNQPQVSNAEAALRNSTYELKPLNYLESYYAESKQSDKYDKLFKSIEGRFAGNPVLYQLLAKNSISKGDLRSAEKYYRECIQVQPMSWTAYMSLGEMLIENGKLEQANKVFISYPAFKVNTDENPVGISNYSHTAGSKFYWLGEFSLATPLYKIASRKETGSNADITSRLRLKLINGDFRGALLGSLERARHYNDSYAYRDYLGMLHAMGASKEAWDAFNVLVNQFDDSHLWEAVLVAHRKESKSEVEVAEWVKQEIQHKVGENTNRAAKYLLRAGVTDRTPSKNFATTLAGVVQPVWKLDYANGIVIQSSNDGTVQSIQGPQSPGNSVLPIGIFDTSKKTSVKSSLVYFSEGYRSIRTADYISARTSLQEASALYDLSNDDLSYILPYYAFAAASTGDVSGIEKYMAGFSPEKRGFDYFLAQAVISGMNGKTLESVQFLKSALYRRPFTEDRPLQTEYEYAEICKLLFEATSNSKYKELALDWARKNQKFQPWFAWAYAIEAVYSTNIPEKKRAIAMAYYLDPQSEMLGHISIKEKEGASKEFEGGNPFKLKNNLSAQTPI